MGSKYEEMLDAFRDEFDAKVMTLAESVRDELVVPACKRYNLGYVAGNGSYWFSGVRHGEKVSVSDIYDAEKLGLHDLIAVMDALDLEVMNNDVLGYYVRAVPEPPPRAKRSKRESKR